MAPDLDPNEIVFITHPNLPPAEPGQAPRHAFESVWEPKGWEAITADEAAAMANERAAAQVQAEAAAAEGGGEVALSKMRKDQLLVVAEAEGVVVDPTDTNAEIVDAIEAHREGGS